MQASGDIFSVPAENGFVKDLTRTSGAAERYPAWSPDGKSIAYWSDESGEYELYIMQPDKESSAKKLTSYGAGFRYDLFWSPDSKKLAFIDKAMKIQIYDVATDKTTDVDKAFRMDAWSAGRIFSAAGRPTAVGWLITRTWIIITTLFLFMIITIKSFTRLQVVFIIVLSCFDPEGKYLYVFTNQSFNPSTVISTIHLSMQIRASWLPSAL